MGVIRTGDLCQGEIVTDSSGKKSLTVRLLAFCSSLDDNLSVIKRDLYYLQEWQPHPTEPGFYVSQFRATQRKHTPNWECQIDYVDSVIQNPLEVPARIGEVKSFTIPGATLVDYQNAPILNTAGEPPEPFDKPEQIIAFPIIKNIPDLGDWLFDFESVLNQDSIRLGSKSCDPLTVMIRQVTVSDTQEQAGIQYRVATMELWRRKSKWLELWPSRGYNQLLNVPVPTRVEDNEQGGTTTTFEMKNVLRPILINAERPSEPPFLDKNGKWIQNPTPDQIAIITTQLYPAINFSGYFPLK